MTPPRRLLALLLPVVAALSLAACGEKKVELAADATADERRGAELFYQRCAGCHTLDAAASEGSAANVRSRERLDGPNFNQRKETVATVLCAIRNGGYSGALMPQNIVVGDDAVAVAEFVARYSGTDAERPPSPRDSDDPTGERAEGCNFSSGSNEAE